MAVSCARTSGNAGRDELLYEIIGNCLIIFQSTGCFGNNGINITSVARDFLYLERGVPAFALGADRRFFLKRVG